MVTHNFLPKWFPWQPISYDMSTISVLARIQNMLNIGLKATVSQCPILLVGTLSPPRMIKSYKTNNIHDFYFPNKR